MIGGNHILPNLVIAGTFKAGTSSLFTYLTNHHDVFKPSKKEIHYFTPLVYNSGEIKSLEHYKSFFRKYSGKEKIIPEASPAYIYGGDDVIRHLIEVLPSDHKVVVMLRNPRDRFISYYKHLKSKYLIEDSFQDFYLKCKKAHTKRKSFSIGHYCNAIEEGMYFNYLPVWIEAYGENLEVVLFENFITNTESKMIELANWLGISKSFYKKYDFRKVNKSQKTHSKTLHKIAIEANKLLKKVVEENLRKKLVSFYNLLNSDGSYFEIDNQFIKELDSIYSKPNKELSALLEKHHYNTPEW